MSHPDDHPSRSTSRLPLRRRGFTVVLVLGLVSIALALSYALLRGQVTTQLVDANYQRLNDAHGHARTGLMLALRLMHTDQWQGVDSSFRQELGPGQWVDVRFIAGDDQLGDGHPDLGEYPYRVTIQADAYVERPGESSVRSHQRAEAVVRLVRRALSPAPDHWAADQAWTVLQYNDDENTIQSPMHMTGSSRWNGSLRLLEEDPDNALARYVYLRDLEMYRQSQRIDYRPVTGPVTMDASAADVETSLLLQNMNVGLQFVADSLTPLEHTDRFDTYRLYPGGPEYAVPLLPSNLHDRTLAPDVSTNPLGIFRLPGGGTLGDDVQVQGMLVVPRSDGDLFIEGAGVRCDPVELPPLADSSVRYQLPALMAGDDVTVRDDAQVEISGLAAVRDRLTLDRGTNRMSVDLVGALACGRLKVRSPPAWRHDNGWWTVRLFEFVQQRELDGGEPYFPVWLRRLHGVTLASRFTVAPPDDPVTYHWQDWSNPVYAVHPDDEGLRWEIVRWRVIDATASR